jgi:hypothetical protein
VTFKLSAGQRGNARFLLSALRFQSWLPSSQRVHMKDDSH